MTTQRPQGHLFNFYSDILRNYQPSKVKLLNLPYHYKLIVIQLSKDSMLDYSMSKHTPEQLRRSIIQEPIPRPTYPANELATTLHYSLCKKESSTVSFITNQRLLILNQADGTLYYINETVSSPFKSESKVPKPKNEAAFINLCIAKREGAGSDTLIVTFNKRGPGDKSKLECVEWRFVFGSIKLATQWEELIKDKKLERMAKAIGVDAKDKKALSTINDTVSFALMPQQGSAIKKLQDEDESKQRKDLGNFFMNINVHKPAEQNERNYEATNSQSPKDQRASGQKKFLNNLVIEEVDEYDTENRTVTSPKEAYTGGDWNLKLIHNRSEQTIKQFEECALKQFLSLKVEEMDFGAAQLEVSKAEKPVILIQNNLNIFVAPVCSQVAAFLREQFINYSYIVESCQQNTCVGVPLACLIEHRGVVCLVKASFPEQAKIMDMGKNAENSGFGVTVESLFKQLQTYTKIRTAVLKESSVVLNLSIPYGLTQHGIPRIYIDEISQYLPCVPRAFKNKLPLTQSDHVQLVRPELILHNFSRIIRPDEPQTAEELEHYIEQAINELAELLVSQEQVPATLADLQQLVNYYGVSLGAMPALYYTIDIRTKKQAHKHVKKLLQSSMAALYVVESEVEPVMGELRAAGRVNMIEETVEGIYGKYCQGGTALNDESWKKLTLQFKKHYEIPLVSHEIEPTLFLAALMHLIPGQYDMSKLDKTKKLFKQRPVLATGFLKQTKPKVSSFTNFMSTEVHNVMKLCQIKSLNNLGRIEGMYRAILEDSKIRDQFLLGRRKSKFYAYLSNFISPFDNKYDSLSQQIYRLRSEEPVSQASHQISVNYLKFLCLDPQPKRPFPQCLRDTQTLTSFWLSGQHPYLCALLDLLGQYHFRCLNQYEESVTLMKECLIISRKVCGPRNLSTASRYQSLGERQLTHGDRREAREHLGVAREVLEDAVDKWIEQYAMVLGKMAKLELADGNLDAAIADADRSNKKLERIRVNKSTHGYFALTYSQINSSQVDNFTVLARAYEVLGNYPQLKKTALQMGKLLNRESNPLVFEQLLRVSLTGLLFGLPDSRLQKLKQFMQYSRLYYIKQQLEEQGRTVDKIRDLLMLEAQNVAIIDRINSRLEHIDRITDTAIKFNNQVRPEPQDIKEFRVLWQAVVDCLGGNEYLEQLIEDFQDK